jgi:hypothetical protein
VTSVRQVADTSRHLPIIWTYNIETNVRQDMLTQSPTVPFQCRHPNLSNVSAFGVRHPLASVTLEVAVRTSTNRGHTASDGEPERLLMTKKRTLRVGLASPGFLPPFRPKPVTPPCRGTRILLIGYRPFRDSFPVLRQQPRRLLGDQNDQKRSGRTSDGY